MKFGLIDGREGGKHNGVNFVEICTIFVMQDVFNLALEPISTIHAADGYSLMRESSYI